MIFFLMEGSGSFSDFNFPRTTGRFYSWLKETRNLMKFSTGFFFLVFVLAEALEVAL